MALKSDEQLKQELGQKPRSPQSNPRSQQTPQSGQIPTNNLGGVLDKQQSDRGSQMAALQSQIIRAQNDASKMTVMVSHQVAQVKEDLADLIEGYYGGLPQDWYSMTSVLSEVEKYLGDTYTVENKLLLQEGAFIILAGRAHQAMLLGVQPITIYDMPALAGYQGLPALNPAQ